MNASRRLGLLFAITLPALAPPVQAASGSIDSFGASATQVNVGDTVDFSVQFSVFSSSTTSGGSNPVEPAPQDGFQEWNVNWYSWEFETLSSVSLVAGGANFADYPALAAGSSYGNSWSFSMTFAQAGSHYIDVSGGWQVDVASGYSNESATRNCSYVDPTVGGELFCDGWTWQYADADDHYTADGTFSAGGIRIEVLEPTVAVPEPATALLWLAGAGLLGWRLRRRGAPR